MTLRLLCLLPFLILSNFCSLGQVFEPGLLVKSNGDTLRGEIENGFWNEPPTFIRFRTAPNAPSQLFQPRQLLVVSFSEGRYFSYEALPIDHAAKTELHRLSRGNYFDVRIDTVLAEVLLNGPLPLRRIVQNGTAHYLLRGANKPVLDLSERKYLRQTANGAWAVADGNNYRAQLTLYFSDCPDAIAAAQVAPFTAEGIIAVVQAYNQSCSADRQPTRSWLAQAKPRRHFSFQGGVLAGVRYNRIESAFYELRGPCADCRPHPLAGLYGELLQPSRKAALYGEISFSSFRSQIPITTGFVPQTGFPIYKVEAYRALLGTARLGVRYFSPLSRDNQLLIGFDYEMNRVMASTADAGNNDNERALAFGVQTLIPGLELGWRNERLTFVLNGKIYTDSKHSSIFSSVFFGSNYIVRTSLSYRLSNNHDAIGTSKVGQQ